MKASELMIGDWVRMRRCDIPDATFYTSKVISLQKDGFLEYEPIPLVEEILKANGWEFDKYSQTWSPKDMCYYEFALNRKFQWIKKHECYGDEDYIATCDEVHKLQHALRLCGLNDLANNLKLKNEKQ